MNRYDPGDYRRETREGGREGLHNRFMENRQDRAYRNYGQDEYVDNDGFRMDERPRRYINDEEDRWTNRDDQIRQQNFNRAPDREYEERRTERFPERRPTEERRFTEERKGQQFRQEQVRREYLDQQNRAAGLNRKNAAGGSKRSDERLYEEVCHALERDRHVSASAIEVGVVNGIVTLNGLVDSRSTRFDAEMIVDSIPGVEDIENNLKVRKWSERERPQQHQ